MRSAAVLAVLASMAATSFGAAGANAEGVVPVEGPWHATTSAGLPVRFSVEGGQVVGYRFRFNWGSAAPTPLKAARRRRSNPTATGNTSKGRKPLSKRPSSRPTAPKGSSEHPAG